MGRRLGQHFLTSRRAVADITHAAHIKRGETVLEIGPGRGALTEALLRAGARVVAFEKDAALAARLEKRFHDKKDWERLKLVGDDIFNLHAHASAEKLLAGSYKIVANIPYYITGKLFRFVFSQNILPTRVVVLLQKEVAERIAAKNGKESILSLSVKAYGGASVIRIVPARCFAPPPKVDSAVLLVTDISKNFFRNVKSEDFFSLVKKGFASRRKLLARNIGVAPELLEECGAGKRARAEELSLDKWRCVYNACTNKQWPTPGVGQKYVV